MIGRFIYKNPVRGRMVISDAYPDQVKVFPTHQHRVFPLLPKPTKFFLSGSTTILMMEVDSSFDEDQGNKLDLKDGKRTKWQLPPSHIAVFSNPPESIIATTTKSKHSRPLLLSSTVDSQGNETTGTTNIQDCETVIDADGGGGNNNITLEDIAETLAAPKLSRLSVMARAEICPKIKRARLMSTKGVAAKIMEQYGYDISNTTFLYAEETIYLLELGKLEVNLGRMALSVERARALLLHSKSHPYNPDSNIAPRVRTCSVDEYLVYKHLSELGYRVRRRDSDVKINVSQSVLSASRERLSPVASTSDDVEMATSDCGNLLDGCQMDLDEESVLIPSGEDGKNTINDDGGGMCQKGTKRKFGELSSDNTLGSTTSSAKDISDDDYADEEFELTQNPAVSEMGGSGGFVDSTGDNNSLFYPTTTSNYTVIEADSDVEITDEPEPITGPSCNNGVHIEEIGYYYDADIEEDPGTSSQEPQPSTSAACFSNDYQQHAVVHLADSDSETENFPNFHKMWNKFVPNATIQIGFPPASLLPPNIPYKESIYEFELKSRESTRSDSDLEYYVDELTLNPSPTESDGKPIRVGSSCQTWTEWRDGTMTEARGVLSESLLRRCSMFTGSRQDPMQKLHLWGVNNKEPQCKRRTDQGWKGFNIPYELFHPSVGFTKQKNKEEFLPSYVVAVVRNDDQVPSFAACDSLVNDIPVLIAVVSDESTIMFMNPDGSPIPSLF
ncbi:uncharacterized protein LOC110842062 isoform X3 [Folsomia candida]|uniref:uncharacterized protein LOC110842062 isoform X3 n=1 Tax=Folsomia candida TaxID=158441 RepID=UPI000B8F7B2B|nr:uncharacterized protein LOC110842062 isoform X3 [Folsomia candida]